MEIMSIEVFSQASNHAVVRMPGRRLPGSLVQGVSLALLVRSAHSIHELALKSGQEELIGESELLLESLTGRLQFYKQILAEHGLDKPY